jgi:Tfp pilus assembly protein PilN
MFTIDLLKGRGLPAKSRPTGIVATVVAIAVPIIVASMMFSCYLRNAITISIKQHAIASYQSKVDKLSQAVKVRKSLAEETNLYTDCLSEVKSSILKHTQWSPVVTTVVENLPDSVVLTKLEVTQQHTKRKVPKKDDPKKTIDITVPLRTLKISVAADPRLSSDEAVRDFRNHLLDSIFLQQKLTSINVSQTSGTLGDQEVVSYEIDCVFKPPL